MIGPAANNPDITEKKERDSTDPKQRINENIVPVLQFGSADEAKERGWPQSDVCVRKYLTGRLDMSTNKWREILIERDENGKSVEDTQRINRVKEQFHAIKDLFPQLREGDVKKTYYNVSLNILTVEKRDGSFLYYDLSYPEDIKKLCPNASDDQIQEVRSKVQDIRNKLQGGECLGRELSYLNDPKGMSLLQVQTYYPMWQRLTNWAPDHLFKRKTRGAKAPLTDVETRALQKMGEAHLLLKYMIAHYQRAIQQEQKELAGLKAKEQDSTLTIEERKREAVLEKTIKEQQQTLYECQILPQIILDMLIWHYCITTCDSEEGQHDFFKRVATNCAQTTKEVLQKPVGHWQKPAFSEQESGCLSVSLASQVFDVVHQCKLDTTSSHPWKMQKQLFLHNHKVHASFRSEPVFTFVLSAVLSSDADGIKNQIKDPVILNTYNFVTNYCKEPLYEHIKMHCGTVKTAVKYLSPGGREKVMKQVGQAVTTQYHNRQREEQEAAVEEERSEETTSLNSNT